MTTRLVVRYLNWYGDGSPPVLETTYLDVPAPLPTDLLAYARSQMPWYLAKNVRDAYLNGQARAAIAKAKGE